MYCSLDSRLRGPVEVELTAISSSALHIGYSSMPLSNLLESANSGNLTPEACENSSHTSGQCLSKPVEGEEKIGDQRPQQGCQLSR